MADAPFDFTSSQWWDPPPGTEPHSLLIAALEVQKSNIQKRHEQTARDELLLGVDVDQHGMRYDALDEDSPKFSPAENAIDTVVSITCKERVLPMAITEGGTQADQEKAKEFNRWLVGLLEEGGAYDLDDLVAEDALCTEAGVFKVVERANRVEVERVRASTLWADRSEARYGLRRLRTLGQFHTIDRLVLLEEFRDPETKRVPQNIRDAIMKASLTDDDAKTYKVDRTSDMIVVHEAWHLKSGPLAKDGRRIIALRNATLVLEDYDAEEFPFVFEYYKTPRVGIWQKSVLSKLAGPQRVFDRLNEKIDEAHDLLGVPRILVGNGSNLKKSDIDDVPGAIIGCDDINQVKEWNAVPISPAEYEYREQIANDMLRFFGISSMSANSQVPAGLSQASGKALEVFGDSESDRLSRFWNQRQRAFVSLAKKMLELAKEIGERTGGYVVNVEDGKQVRAVKLSDVDITGAEARYKLVVQPTSFLAKKASAKYAQLSEMRDRGDISREQFLQHLDMPDTLAVSELETAPSNLVDRRIGQIFSDSKPFIVEPFHPHALLFERGLKAYDLAQCRNESEAKLQLLRDAIVKAHDYMSGKLEAMAMPTPAPAPGAPPAPPPAPPMPPPAGMPPAAPPMAA